MIKAVLHFLFRIILLSMFSASLAFAGQTLSIAAAADLAPCIEELNHAFVKQAGAVDIKTSIGSSGNFFAQIKNGAPFEVFLSADLRYPTELARAGYADADSLTLYAHGQLVMWTKNSAIDVSQGLRLLTDPRIKRIAIANPEFAPYGRAAKAALEKAGIWEQLVPKIVFGENIAQTTQFAQSGNADIGFISGAHAASSKGGRSWQVPAEYYPLIEQAAVVTAKGHANPLARRYVAFLRSDAARAVFAKHGFSLQGVSR
ncbi:MAG: molybdate ABC transporter substrate-binding protein [Burkholderiales bacterium]|nr:molybdate ABC transporter substrate-binding protein [Burkholderiales bacterium]